MGSKLLRIVETFVGVVVIMAFVNAKNELPERVGSRSYGNFQFVVTVDGISYYATKYDRMNFLESSEYCEDFGMELASVPSRKHYYAITDALKAANNYGYWTSATFSKKPGMFQWGDTGKLLDADEIPSWQNRWLRRTSCVILYTSHTDMNPTGLYVVNCTNIQPALCQTSLKVE